MSKPNYHRAKPAETPLYVKTRIAEAGRAQAACERARILPRAARVLRMGADQSDVVWEAALARYNRIVKESDYAQNP